MRRPTVTALAAALLLGLPPPWGSADPVCVVAATFGGTIPENSAGRCVPTSFPAACRWQEVGLGTLGAVRLTVCQPRLA